MRHESFRDQPHTRAQGRLGEQEGVDWLRRQGYRVIERNVVTRSGEIDVVAEEGGALCFVEIKARASRAYGLAIEAVPVQKQRRLARAAALYLVRHPTDLPCRFDVLGMDLHDGLWSFTLVRDAFQVPAGSFGRR